MSEYLPSHSRATLILDSYMWAILENMSDGFVLLDTTWRIMYVNPQAESILDRTREELLGKNLWDAFPEAVDTPFWTKFHEAADTQSIVEFEDFYPSTLKRFYMHVYPSETGLAINFQDITERKQAEEVRLQLAAIVESSDDAIIGKTREGVITSWNRAAERIYGYSAEEVMGRPITLIFPPDRQDEFARIMEQILRGERVDHYETTRLRKGGTILSVSVTISPICDSDGQVIGASTIAHDITERKRAEEQEHFLAEVSKVLTSTLDYQETLANIARLVVPQLADWFAVDLVDAEGHFELIEIAHKDPAQVRWARALREKYPVDPNALTGAPHVVRTGQSELYPEITDEMLVAAARNEEELSIARQIGYTSVIVVPLVARGKTLGAVTLVATESRRRYSERDLALVEEIGRRAGVALDNARLYREVAQARDQLDIILQGVADGIIVYDSHSQIIYVNEAAAQMTGYTSVQDMLQTPPLAIVARYEIVDEQGLPFPRSQLTHIRVFAGEREAQAIIGYVNKASGHPERWSLTKSRPIFDENGNVTMVITIIHDLRSACKPNVAKTSSSA
ncbi:MAG: PAS domain S-box protein [Ktedonobacteraceae bacterium]